MSLFFSFFYCSVDTFYIAFHNCNHCFVGQIGRWAWLLEIHLHCRIFHKFFSQSFPVTVLLLEEGGFRVFIDV